jgi:elongation factor P
VASTNDLKNGLVLNIDGQLWTVIEFQHVKPGKGPAFVRTKLKNVITGKVVDKTFNAGVSVETADVDKRDMQYLYRDGDNWVFMDLKSYDQYSLSNDLVGDSAQWMLENQEAIVAIYENEPIYL